MADVRFEGAPLLEGWVMGAAMGLVAFAASVVVGEFDLMPAAFFGVVVAGAAGAVMGFPWWIGGPVSPASSAAFAARVAAADEARAAASAAPVARIAPVAKASPVAAAPVAAAAMPAALLSTPAADTAGPVRHSAPQAGKADTLRDIEGVGPVTERMLNSLGFWHFEQVANWTDADVAWVEENLRGFKGRVTRDKWVAQAKIIVTEGMASFRQRARRNDY